MGRHRRSGAAPAEADYATGTDRGHGGTRRKRRHPVRNGLIGASAAVAVGAAAVASGLLPGGETVTAGSVGSARPAAAETRQTPELTTQGGGSRTPASPSTGAGKATGAGASTSKEAGKGTPEKKKSPVSASPTAKPSPTKTAKTEIPAPEPKPSKTRTAAPAPATTPAKPKAKPKPEPEPEPSKLPATTKAAAPKPAPTTEAPAEETTTPPAGSTADRADAAEAEVLRLVNVERAKVGCVPVQPSDSLARLAGNLSADMANRGFFDHTDPDGATPWDRAQAAGITNLGAENIARGQVDATAAMVSWMNSDGHRANILNCDLTTLGVGVHFADGGPWWTQDFGR
ncbi:CAP domain-containing protein [Streptomyces sp. NPDC007818]|uniref:CAP domain-containing protein n=1 Tax=Streptomyces sp. NPDC007818 TaxID=3364780 RepID=UPI0036D1AF4D